MYEVNGDTVTVFVIHVGHQLTCFTVAPPHGVIDDPVKSGPSRPIIGKAEPTAACRTKLRLAVSKTKAVVSSHHGRQRGDAPPFEVVMAGIKGARLDGGRPRTPAGACRADKAYCFVYPRSAA